MHRVRDHQGLVVALLDDGNLSGLKVGDKIRDLTESWLRFKYGGELLIGEDPTALLDHACSAGYECCLILSYGTIVLHAWNPELFDTLEQWFRATKFLVAGDVNLREPFSYGIEKSNLLVNLEEYDRLGRPTFGAPSTTVVDVAQPGSRESAEIGDLDGVVLWPGGARAECAPALFGWHIVSVSLSNNIPVYRLPNSVRTAVVSIVPVTKGQDEEWKGLLGNGIKSRELNSRVLSDSQIAFLKGVQNQIINSRDGVFVWNFEDHEDVRAPCPAAAPLSSVYSVAAGLKTNWILATHGFDEHTRIVYFDYSERALEFKRYLHENWDGTDYPSFLRRLFTRLKPDQTFYQLWGGRSPGNVDWQTAERLWQQEVDRWDGEESIRMNWAQIKGLKVEYVCCDMLSESNHLLHQIRTEDSSVIWWSNVFFSFFSNWHYMNEERRSIFQEWTTRLAEKCPDLLVYGKDWANADIAGQRISTYVSRQYLHAPKSLT